MRLGSVRTHMPKRHLSATLIRLCLLTFAASPAGAEEPSLSETLVWMDSTYNPHQEEGGSWGHGREEIFSAGKPFKRRSSTFSYDDCNITLRTNDDPTTPLYRELYSSYVYSFNLKDIDPNSIRLSFFDPQLGGLSCDWELPGMVCSIAEMELETRNQLPLMEEDFHLVYPKLSGNEHDVRRTDKTFVAAFFIDDAKYAERFAKAFRHAIELCGGKASPF